MSILRLGRFVPTSIREWDAIFRSLNTVIDQAADGTVTVTADNLPPQDAAYVTLSNNASLTGDRVLTPVVGELTGTDAGANTTYTLGLADVGTAGTYTKVTVDAKGRVTASAVLAETDIPAEIQRVPDELDAATAVALTDTVIVSQSGDTKAATVQQVKDILFGDDWDDLRFPMNSVDPTGLAAPATRVTSLTGYTGALEFAGNAENVCAGIAQMPHAWKRESDIRPHIHWTKPTGSANAVTWELYYRIIGNPGDAVGSWTGPVSPTATIGDQTVSNEHLLTYWPAIDMAGLIESAIVYWRLHRQGGTDADNTAVICHELDFHYQTDKAGTDSEIPS